MCRPCDNSRGFFINLLEFICKLGVLAIFDIELDNFQIIFGFLTCSLLGIFIGTFWNSQDKWIFDNRGSPLLGLGGLEDLLDLVALLLLLTNVLKDFAKSTAPLDPLGPLALLLACGINRGGEIRRLAFHCLIRLGGGLAWSKLLHL